jgi:Ca2+-transporting ATPase
MMTPSTPSTPIVGPSDIPDPSGGPVWFGLSSAQACSAAGVDPASGLDPAGVIERRRRHGPNRLAEPPVRPRWMKFLDQFRSGIVLILAVAAVVAGAVGDLKDTVVIAAVLLINAALGYLQEAKAETALAALEEMLVAVVRVRRSGRSQEVAAEELVPGDIVLLEPGDRVPVDGRLLVAAGLTIDESALTGESAPVDKWAEPIVVAPGVDLALGDRANLAYMNTTVTRGRAELLVTDTGMGTEMGRVAGLLAEADPGPTPLERQLDQLTTRLALIACAAVALVFGLEVAQGRSMADALLGAVALAVAAIPEGLPAVVTVTLAVGVSKMAKHNAIVRRLHSVETLGSTTVICSDKTGTLTLNQMTAREVVRGHLQLEVEGTGYGSAGRIKGVDGAPADPLGLAGEAAALCSEAVIHDGELVGDPTEGALVVLATKGGVDVDKLRRSRPRIGEVPFDSAIKYMATYHRDGPDVVCLVKGAPDRLLDRCTRVTGADGTPVPLDAEGRAAQIEENDRLAAEGLRVLALASRRMPSTSLVLDDDGVVVHPDRYLEDLTLEALVGIVDPARDEARQAIARCGAAGIEVKMITGDHAATAAAIAGSLGITGDVVTGDELDGMDDEALAARIDGIGVCARVSPEHKVRVVRALQANGQVAAMTGDGVNDAAALRTADIGVAMGITGTEVTKEAADMVLADDNFATIVQAVERGRTIYANIVKFVRFQLSTNLGAIATILGASLLALPVPFSPIQVLWVNLIADGPPAMTLGVDPPDDLVMQRPPRGSDAAILTGRRIGRLLFFAAIMAAGSLGLLVYARQRWGEEVALTMTFTTFVLFQMVNVFNARTERESAFSRQFLANRKLLAAVATVVVLQLLTVIWVPLQRLFGTVDLTAGQILLCLAVASTVLWLEELRKLGVRLLKSS